MERQPHPRSTDGIRPVSDGNQDQACQSDVPTADLLAKEVDIRETEEAGERGDLLERQEVQACPEVFHGCSHGVELHRLPSSVSGEEHRGRPTKNFNVINNLL